MKFSKLIMGSLLIGVFITGFSCLIFSGTGKTYAAFYNSHTEKIRDIQLMLALKGIRVGASKESIQINGKFDSLTEEGIKTYQNQNNLPETGDISEALYYKLYKDIQLHNDIIDTGHGTSHARISDQATEAILLELNKTKEDLKNTNSALKSLTENMAGHFISNFRDVTALVGVGLGILAGILGGFFVWGYSELQKKITEKITNESKIAQENMVMDSKFRIYVNLSNAFYVYYRELLNNPTHPGFNSGTKLAAYFSDLACKSAEAMVKTQETLSMVNTAQLHKMYHLTSQSLITPSFNKKEIMQKALEYTGYINGLLEDKNYQTKIHGIACKESIAWILTILGDEIEKERGRKILEEVLEDKNTPPSYLKELKENYERMKEGLTKPQKSD